MVALLSPASRDNQRLLSEPVFTDRSRNRRWGGGSFLFVRYYMCKWLLFTFFCWQDNAVSVADHYHHHYNSDHRRMVWMVTVSVGWVYKDLLVDCGLFQGYHLQLYCHTDLFSGHKWISKYMCVCMCVCVCVCMYVRICVCVCVILVVFLKRTETSKVDSMYFDALLLHRRYYLSGAFYN
jgi:hypothetical protein